MRILAGTLTVTLAIAVPAIAQQQAQPSLAEVARQAEAAKPTIKKAKKSYTNADLGPDGLPPAPPAAPPSGYVSKTLGKEVPPDEMLQRSEKQVQEQAKADALPETRWRERAQRLRSDVEGAQARLSRLTSRPPNANVTMQERADKEIAAIRTGLNTLRTQWIALEQDARTAKINMDWLQPVPQFPTP